MITMINDDFLKASSVIEDNSVDFIFLDLPYGTTRNKWDTIIPFEKVWGVVERIRKPNTCIVFTAAGMFTSKVIMSMPKLYKYSLVWEKTTKTNFLNRKKQFLRSHEDIVIFYEQQPTFNPIITSGHKRKVSTAEHKRNSKITTNYNEAKKVDYDSTERYSGSVLKFSNDKQKSSINPTQKPVKLIESLLSVFTLENDLIADLTAGSFSCGVACKNMRRRYIGFEIDKLQFSKAQIRLGINE